MGNPMTTPTPTKDEGMSVLDRLVELERDYDVVAWQTAGDVKACIEACNHLPALLQLARAVRDAKEAIQVCVDHYEDFDGGLDLKAILDALQPLLEKAAVEGEGE